jgi:hypothetical protein
LIKSKPFSQIFQSGSDVWHWQTAWRQNQDIASATAPGITVLAVFLGAGCRLTIEYAARRRFAIDRSLAIERLRFARWTFTIWTFSVCCILFACAV